MLAWPSPPLRAYRIDSCTGVVLAAQRTSWGFTLFTIDLILAIRIASHLAFALPLVRASSFLIPSRSYGHQSELSSYHPATAIACLVETNERATDRAADRLAKRLWRTPLCSWLPAAPLQNQIDPSLSGPP
jgi:hypothetical protein